MIKRLRVSLEQNHRQWLWISLGVGSLLRWLRIGTHSFWYDETFSMLTARLPIQQILSNAAIDVHPPGYYLLLYGWLYIGQSEAIIRTFSALCSVGAIWLLYHFAKWLFDHQTAALGAIIMAITPFQLYFAQEARMYALVVLLTIALMWVFIRVVSAQSAWILWLSYVALAASGLYIHYFVGFLLVALHVGLIFIWSSVRSSIKSLLIADTIIFLLFLPQLSQALTRASYYLGVEAWQAIPNILSPLTTIYYLLFVHRAPIWIAPIAIFLVLATLGLTLWETYRRPNEKAQFEWMLWFILWLPIIVVVIISWLAPRSIYVERSFTIVSPALILLVTRGFITAPRYSPTPYLTLLLLLVMSLTNFVHLSTPDPAKPPVRAATLTIATHFTDGDVALHLQDASALPSLWYNPEVTHLLADVPNAAFIFDSTHRLFGGDVVKGEVAIKEADRLWLMVMPNFTTPSQTALHDQIADTYPQIMAEDWGTVQLYLYDVKDDTP